MTQLASISDVVYGLNGVVWGPVMIVLLVGTGLYLTVRLGLVQVRYFLHAIGCISGKYDDPKEKGDITHFQALCAALSATVGTGNIAGVATAIALGGPGAVFWMWVTALVGMATKFTSCGLALKFRVLHEDGSASGGPMYYLHQGLGQKWLGVIFALSAGFASLGIGCAVQSNSVTDGLLSVMPANWQEARIGADVAVIGGTVVAKPVIGVVLAILVGVVTIGGIRRIAAVASKIVPLMCVVYVIGAIVILIRYAGEIPGAFEQILRYAFNPVAAGGGFVGVVMARTVQKGVARGVFSNESGLGSAPMAHAAAKTHEPAREGFVAMLGPFIDTILICTMTALVIVVTGAWQVRSQTGEVLYGPGGLGVPDTVRVLEGRPVGADVEGGVDTQVVVQVGEDGQAFVDGEGCVYELPTGAALTAAAFETGFPRVGNYIVAFGLVFFAYSTMIAWSYYGDRCFEYLLGPRAVGVYRYVFCVFVFIGTISGLDLIWTIADNLNALMAVPNLIGLLLLSGVMAKEMKSYVRRMREDGLREATDEGL